MTLTLGKDTWNSNLNCLQHTKRQQHSKKAPSQKNMPLDVGDVSRQILVDGQDPRLGDDEPLKVGVGARARNGLALLENRA